VKGNLEPSIIRCRDIKMKYKPCTHKEGRQAAPDYIPYSSTLVDISTIVRLSTGNNNYVGLSLRDRNCLNSLYSEITDYEAGGE